MEKQQARDTRCLPLTRQTLQKCPPPQETPRVYPYTCSQPQADSSVAWVSRPPRGGQWRPAGASVPKQLLRVLELRTGLWNRCREGLEIGAGEQASRGTSGGVFSWEGTGILLRGKYEVCALLLFLSGFFTTRAWSLGHLHARPVKPLRLGLWRRSVSSRPPQRCPPSHPKTSGHGPST